MSRVCLQSVLAYRLQKCILSKGRMKRERPEVKSKGKGRSLGGGGTSRGTDSLDITDFLPTETMNQTVISALSQQNLFFSFSFSV